MRCWILILVWPPTSWKFSKISWIVCRDSSYMMYRECTIRLPTRRLFILWWQGWICRCQLFSWKMSQNIFLALMKEICGIAFPGLPLWQAIAPIRLPMLPARIIWLGRWSFSVLIKSLIRSLSHWGICIIYWNSCTTGKLFLRRGMKSLKPSAWTDYMDRPGVFYSSRMVRFFIEAPVWDLGNITHTIEWIDKQMKTYNWQFTFLHGIVKIAKNEAKKLLL